MIYHNNLINNLYLQAYAETGNSTNLWNGAYPWCGNYWSNYNGTDSNSGPFKTKPTQMGQATHPMP